LFLTLGWPAAASISLAVAVGKHPFSLPGLLLLACCTAASYALDRWLDHPKTDSASFRKALLLCLLFVSCLGGGLALTAWWRFKICMILGLISMAYVPLKKWIPKNVLTTFSWTVAVSTLPFHDAPDFSGKYAASIFAVFCIMAADTILCDIPDVEADRKAGVRGITPRYGEKVGATFVVIYGLLAAGFAGVYAHWGLSLTGLVLAVLALLMVRTPKPNRYRPWADIVVTFLPGPMTLLIG